MELSMVEHARRVRMVTGCYIRDHAFERARSRGGMADFSREGVERDLVQASGRFYWDKKHENYRFYREDKNQSFAFDVDVHDSRPGLIAIIRTCIPGDDEYSSYRFEEVQLSKFKISDNCESLLKQAEDELVVR